MKSCVSRLSLLLGVVSVIATMLMVQSCGGSEQSGPDRLLPQRMLGHLILLV
jgi:hypothetical protein